MLSEISSVLMYAMRFHYMNIQKYQPTTTTTTKNQYFNNNSDVVITGIYYYLLTLHEILNALLLLLLRVVWKTKAKFNLWEESDLQSGGFYGIVWKHITDITQ